MWKQSLIHAHIPMHPTDDLEGEVLGSMQDLIDNLDLPLITVMEFVNMFMPGWLPMVSMMMLLIPW